MKTLTHQSIRTLLCTSAIGLWLLAPGSPLSAAAPGKTQHLPSLDSVPEGLAPSDWASIRAAYEGQRHAAFAVEGGYQARNPGQQWRTRFDARGFSTQPDAGGWQWGLELRSFGFAGNERAICGQPEVQAAGQRVTYTWDRLLEEWFVNDQRGLEHGFTLKERPPGGNGALNFSLMVRGGLRLELSPDGQAVRFVEEHGTTVINYGGLKVWDADGKILPARFVPAPEGIRLSVDERGARYPITVDPIAEQAYLKASNTGAGDSFGYAVAISGDTVAVGAWREDSGATGVNGNQSDASAEDAGAVYVFVRSGNTWVQQAYLKASNTSAGASFGYAVAISGDTVAVGAFSESSSAYYAGAAYIFVRTGDSWTQQAYLKASNSDPSDKFGYAVAIANDTVVIGAFGESSSATGINGNQSDNSAPNAGAAYVFVRSLDAWWQQAYLKASNTDPGDEFGSAVAISGGTIVIGASDEDSSAVGINGNQSDNSAHYAGAAYVFVRGPARPPNLPSWSQQAYLKASNTGANDVFGFAVGISGNTVVVGAFGEDSNATGVNGNQNDESAPGAGATYVFVVSDGVWAQQAYLKASNPGTTDQFGFAAAIAGETIVVGAPYEDSSGTGVNGNQDDNSAKGAGAAYLFTRSGGIWAPPIYLKAPNPGTDDHFGEAVAISGDTIVAGASSEDSNATGVNGDQSNNSASYAGAAYTFSGVKRPGLVANVSTRLRVGTGENVLIEGFTVQGPAGSTKKIIVRAIGPWLAQFGIADALANPTLEIRDVNNALVATNDNWRITQVGGLITGDQSAEISASGVAPSDDRESAIIANLPPGSYTAVVRGVNNTVGTGIVDAYDLSAASQARLVNVATRGLIQPGDKLMIAGFIVQNGSVSAVVRAIGPSLTAFGISNALPDTTLQLRDQNGAIVRENDDWQTTQKQELEATGLQPKHNREAAVIDTLPAGQYTAQVRGIPETTGIGVVEVYFLQ